MNKYRTESRRAQRARRRSRMCERKIRFETEAEALRQPGMKVYRCGYCDGWHRSAQIAKMAAGISPA